MPSECYILKLSNELLKDILDFIEADPDRSIGIDRRAYLSVESFRLPSPPSPPRAQDIGNFRRSCRRFAELGVPYQFTRIATRFSPEGFKRLDKISNAPHVAKHTKKFSYLIPYFYVEGRERIRELLLDTGGELNLLDASKFEDKARAQRRIIRAGEDVRVLRMAMSAFKSLQHVQILRLLDEPDRLLLEHLHENGTDATRFVDLRWTTACSHATKTVCEALAYSRSPFSRFSGPMMNPLSALPIKNSIPHFLLDPLSERLTCLELHFDDPEDLDNRIRELSDLFQAVFKAAKNMQAVHIGFPSCKPLGLRLEDVFHEIKWEKLRAFGVQSWRLDAEEIIDLARRHRKTLRGLRLRDVLLRKDSMWKSVLAMLREEMEQLEWVSLRRIDYSDHFDHEWRDSVEVPDFPAGASDSDDEDDFQSHIDEDDGVESDDDSDSDSASDHGPSANELALSPDTSAAPSFCICSRNAFPASAEDLGDNGSVVIYQQRKLWEKWVVGRCPEHSGGSSSQS